jgi:D-alanine-D-alanine ligase-like ATP-grasp enzyme
MNMTERTVLDFDGGEPPAWLEQVRRAGRMLHEAIPAEIRAGTVFSVDGILPQDGQVRFLEVNSNPMVHPLVYARMVGDLLPVSLGSDAAAVH